MTRLNRGLVAAFAAGLAACAAPAPNAADLIIANAELISAPGAQADGPTDIAIRDGRVVAIGARLELDATQRIDVGGRVVMAGFWNTHVHLDPTARAPDRQRALERHWLQYGFVHLVDVGSTPGTAQSLIADIAAGRLDGPDIVRAGGSFVARDGTPSYLPGVRLPELTGVAQARAAASAVMAGGADGIKLFSGSFQTPTDTTHLAAELIRAVSETAHAAGGFVVAHPTDAVGVSRAVANGVDILAHTAPVAGPWSDDDVRDMVDRGVALIPTLYLFEWQLRQNGLPDAVIARYTAAAAGQLAAFHAAGGDVLFGTDAGFVTDYDPASEYAAMAAAGLSLDDVHASLTIAPARRFARGAGRLEVGTEASLVVLQDDPREDITALARVALTLRQGRIVFARDD